MRFHTVMNLMDTYIRDANKFWAKNIKDAEADTEKRNQVLIDTLHMVKTAMVLMHLSLQKVLNCSVNI